MKQTIKQNSKFFLLACTLFLTACAPTSNLQTAGIDAAEDLALQDEFVFEGDYNAEDPAYFDSTIGNTVLFATNKSILSNEARVVLQEQAQWLLANPNYKARIEGHADERGTREYNLALGARRANAAQEFLIAQGVVAGRLSIVSYGKERPAELCSQESCYKANRRAVAILLPEGS